MKIVVLVKQVPDTWDERRLAPETGWVDRDASDRVIDEIDERALEVALAVRDSRKGTEVVALSMGPAPVADALRKALAMGADAAVHVLDDALAGSDAAATAVTLAAALRHTGFDLVIAGNESTDGGGGIVPSMVAEHLGLPLVGSLNSVEISDAEVRGERGVDSGSMSVHTSIPAIISVTERTPEARFPSFKGIMGAKRKPVTVLSLAQLGLDLAATPRSVVLGTTQRPARAAGIRITDEGNAGTELAEFLFAGRLI